MSRIWVLGGGLIGCGWATAFAGAGHEVTLIDPSPAVEARLQQTWSSGRDVLARLGTLAGKTDAPAFVTSIAAAGKAPDLVQECLPENLSLKIDLLASLEPHLREDTIIASSSSGLSPDDIGKNLQFPQRLLIAHPCNPPYLMPVVELSGGNNTSETVLQRAEQIYSDMGKTVLKLARPVPGHLVNRLQAALWREAVYLAREGIASVSDIERAVTQGLAPRWCFVGPTSVFHLAGADGGGIGRCVEQLGPEFERWWESLGSARLDADTTRVLAEGITAHDARPVAEIAADRDRNVAALLAYLNNKPAQAG